MDRRCSHRALGEQSRLLIKLNTICTVELWNGTVFIMSPVGASGSPFSVTSESGFCDLSSERGLKSLFTFYSCGGKKSLFVLLNVVWSGHHG